MGSGGEDQAWDMHWKDNQWNDVRRRWDVGRDGGENEKKLDGAVRRQWSGIEA